ASYAYNQEGKMTSVTYPLSGLTFTYGYDTMGRPYSLTQTAGTLVGPSATVATSVSYGAAGELLQISNGGGYGSLLESRTYNSLFQLTGVNYYSGSQLPSISYSYTYPDGTNIGKITKRKDLISGEEIQYAYDSLGRMLTAQTTAQSQGAPW